MPRRHLGYFRWYQCFRVGGAVAFPAVGASAFQSSEEPEQVRGSSWTSRLGSGGWAAPGRAGPFWPGSRAGRGLTVLWSLSPLSRVPSLSFTLLATVVLLLRLSPASSTPREAASFRHLSSLQGLAVTAEELARSCYPEGEWVSFLE